MKTNKILLSFIIISLFIITLINAYSPHKQNTDFSVVFDQPNATFCNVTNIQYPDGSFSYINQEMTKTGNTFNFTINSGNFSQIGNTCIGLVCYDPTATPQYEEGSVCREVTISGASEISSGAGISLGMSLFIILILSTFFFIMGIRVNSSVMKIIFLTLSCIILIIAVFYSMVIVQQTLGGFENLVEGYSTFFFVLKILFGIFFLVFMIFALLVAIKFYKFKRGWID